LDWSALVFLGSQNELFRHETLVLLLAQHFDSILRSL
jgi:hypothetical protein